MVESFLSFCAEVCGCDSIDGGRAKLVAVKRDPLNVAQPRTSAQKQKECTMSLLERAQAAQDSTQEVATSNFSKLRAGVQEILPAEKLARLSEAGLQRAKSEVTRACARVFEDPVWGGVSPAQRKELIEQILDSLFGFGPIEDLLADESITEVMVNGPAHVFYERAGKLYESKLTFTSEDQLRALIDRILGPLGRRVDEQCPMANARLPQGHRVHVIMPPISLCGPVLTIRKFSTHVFHLSDLERMGSFDSPVSTFLTWAVRLRKNIAVSGGTGSGKTTLLNAMSCEIPPDERIVTIEDSAELRFFEHPHVVSLEARPQNTEGRGLVTIRDLVINALRMRPDRIVVGECRGAEAADMLQAMSTGHDGSLTTLHANSPAEVVQRLTTMVRYSADLPVDVVETNIACALDLIVQVARAPTGARYVSELALLEYSASERKCEFRCLYSKGPLDESGVWHEVPDWISNVVSFGIASAQEVREWASKCS